MLLGIEVDITVIKDLELPLIPNQERSCTTTFVRGSVANALHGQMIGKRMTQTSTLPSLAIMKKSALLTLPVRVRRWKGRLQ